MLFLFLPFRVNIINKTISNKVVSAFFYPEQRSLELIVGPIVVVSDNMPKCFLLEGQIIGLVLYVI